MIGKGHRGALVTLVERKSLSAVIRSVLHKTAKAVRDAVADGLNPYIDWVHTITYDNGREFADHEGIASDLEASIYFAHPYALLGARFEREYQRTHSTVLPETPGSDDSYKI